MQTVERNRGTIKYSIFSTVRFSIFISWETNEREIRGN